MEFVNPMVEIRIMKTGNDMVGMVKEWPDRIADYLSSFIPLIVEKISFIDRNKAQFPGWPVTHKMSDNDGREVVGWLPQLTFSKPNQVVQVTNKKTNEVLYTIRIQGKSFQPKVYSMDIHEIKSGKNKPEIVVIPQIQPVGKPEFAKKISVSI